MICGETHGEEGFGKALICNCCSASQSEKMEKTSKAVKAPSASKDEGNFETPKYIYIMINVVWRQGGC